MQRREFLNRLLVLGAAGALGMGFASGARAATNGRVLVVVFLRGGWDGLNVAVPYGDDAYYALRPTLAIAPPSGGASAALDLNGFFALHPAMPELHALYAEGRVAVMPSVHYEGASFSHFKSQDVLEDASLTPLSSGWLGRYLGATDAGDGAQRALSMTSVLTRSLHGPLQVAAYSDLGDMALAADANDAARMQNVMAQSYAATSFAGNPNAALLHSTGLQLLTDISALSQINVLPVDGGAVYPSSSFGRQMRQAAGLIKSSELLELVTLNLGGWDTHSAQGAAEGNMAALLGDLSGGVGAFFQDLGDHGNRVTLLLASEFGRTAAENGSGGTDHGHATTWMAIGAGVNGGVHLGSGWPGLSASNLYQGRYLAHSIDFRGVYAECLNRVLGLADASVAVPGYATGGIGFLA